MQIYKKLAMVCDFSFVDIAKMHALGAQTVGSYALCAENAEGRPMTGFFEAERLMPLFFRHLQLHKEKGHTLTQLMYATIFTRIDGKK